MDQIGGNSVNHNDSDNTGDAVLCSIESKILPCRNADVTSPEFTR